MTAIMGSSNFVGIRPKWEVLSLLYFIIDPGARFFVRRVLNIKARRRTLSGEHTRSSAVLTHRQYIVVSKVSAILGQLSS